jgi:hypothetical protein
MNTPTLCGAQARCPGSGHRGYPTARDFEQALEETVDFCERLIIMEMRMAEGQHNVLCSYEAGVIGRQ